MIAKYLDNGVWGYIDNVRQATNQDIDAFTLTQEYDKSNIFVDKTQDLCSYANGEKLSDEIIASNKVFTMACKDMDSLFEKVNYGNAHTVNMLDGKKVIDNYPAAIIILYLNDHKEYDTLAIVTNQECFLMNDKGQTIERLV